MSSTPLPVKRRLRQEAFFGCCVCGLPILQYHHIIPRHVVEHFRPEDMMVLCPNHHDMATKGAFPESEQRRYKAAPFNLKRGYANGILAIEQSYCAFDFGSVQMVSDRAFFSVDGELLLGVRVDAEGRLGLSLTLYDDADALLVLIDDDEWISGDPAVWDLEADWQRLTLRRSLRDIRLRLDASRFPMRLKARLRKNGALIDITPRGVFLDDGTRDIASSLQELCLVNMGIHIDTASGEIRLGEEREGVIVSDPDHLSRLARGTQAFAKLRARR